MKGLREKFRKHEGFTLVEMLIVVAIIAILIAVSIPIVNNALDKARHATDSANERAAKAEMIIQYLAGDDAVPAKISTTTTYYYDAANGKLDTDYSKITTSYGQCTHGGHDTQRVLALKISDDGEVSMRWVSSATNLNDIDNSNLCSTAKGVEHPTT